MRTVRLYGAAADAAGVSELLTDSTCLRELREELSRLGLAAVLPRCSYLLDGRAVSHHGDADLSQVATVDVLPPFAGG